MNLEQYERYYEKFIHMKGESLLPKGNANKKYDYDKDKDIKNAIEKLEKEFAGNGRVLIRPSGTEPLVRVMIEGEDQEYITKKAKEIAKLIEEKLK